MPLPDSPLKLARKALETRLDAIYEELLGEPNAIDWRYRSVSMEVFETIPRGSIHPQLKQQEKNALTNRTFDVLFRLMFASPDIETLNDMLNDHCYYFLNHVFKKLQSGVEITWNTRTYKVFQNMDFTDEITILKESPDGGGIETCVWVLEWKDINNALEGGFESDFDGLFDI